MFMAFSALYHISVKLFKKSIVLIQPAIEDGDSAVGKW